MVVRVRGVIFIQNGHIYKYSHDSGGMILVAFDGKFDETKDEIPPGICRPHIFQNSQY